MSPRPKTRKTKLVSVRTWEAMQERIKCQDELIESMKQTNAALLKKFRAQKP